jgi:glycosyltransferase involved in cell wall biosynthesis
VTAESAAPLVSIGVPTYNRVATLERTLASAIAQTYSPIEVVISDNGSEDGTEELCRSFVARDSRVSYLRHHRNVGSTVNFNRLFEACRGDYVMMLADDDWIDAGYVAACVAALEADRSASLVAGLARYMRGGSFVRDGVLHTHSQRDPADRVRHYLATVDDNGVFYGLMPRAVLDRARPLPNVLGNDWLHVARIACQGRIATLEDVRIYREVGGTSVNISSIVASFGQSEWQARVPQLVIAWNLLRDVGWAHPVYTQLGWVGRLTLAVRGAAASMRWRALAWHLVTPTVAKLAGRRRGRVVAELYVRVTRALGAGRGP